MTDRPLYLLAYDVTDPRRRAKALQAARGFGIDGQYSAHECLLSRAERRELLARLERLLDPKTDRLLLMRLDPRAEILVLGAPRAADPRPNFLYFG